MATRALETRPIGGETRLPGFQPTGLLGLLAPKWRAAGRRVETTGTTGRIAVLGGLGLVFWAVLYALIYRMLIYFRAAEGIGDVLATKLLGLILLTFLSILLLSNVITALSSFFLARDLELLRAAPVDGFRVYTARLIESGAHSSWMVVLVLLPMLAAYGWAYRGGLAYIAAAVLTLASFLVLPAVIGTGITLLLVNIFPARRARDLLALIALFGAAGLVLFVRLLRPEQLANPEGFRNLVDFVASLQTPQSIWLPSEWAANALMATLRTNQSDLFPLLLLATTAAAFIVLGSWLHGLLYPDGYSRAQEGAELREQGSAKPLIEKLLVGATLSTKALVGKDIRTFFRDATQWSQLILLAVLVVIYIYNVRVLPLWTGEEVGFFLVNTISFLNLGLAGFVLAAIAARFLFPAVSLEGKTMWLLRSSPLDLRKLIWTKYWVGLLPLLVLALALTAGTNLILRVGPFMMWLSLGTITLITFVMGALAIGFGALFPRFDTENTAQIPTGFGGFLFMMTATVYLAVVVALEAWPVYTFLQARLRGEPVGFGGVALSLVLVVAISAAATFFPLRIAVERVGELEG